jgi:hypothetical protein
MKGKACMPGDVTAAKKTFRKAVLRQIFSQIGKSYLSVLPIAVMITILYFVNIIDGFYLPVYITFLIAVVLIGLGLALFQLGSDQSIARIGTIVGSSLFKQRNIWLISIMTFVLGLIITVAEPDLKVMAAQIGFDNEALLIVCVGVGVGLFMMFGVLRILLQKELNVVFLAFYALIFTFAGITNPKFLPISFDSGAVVTGPVTIPFILAFGASLAASRGNSNGHSSSDAFGLTALATAGPILTVMILSRFVNVSSLVYRWDPSAIIACETWEQWGQAMGPLLQNAITSNLLNLLIAIGPLAVFFLVYNWIFVKLPFKQVLKIMIGLLYAYFGLVLFMVAVNIGFLPVAQKVGYALGSTNSLYPLAIVMGGLFGLFGVIAEPAVHILVHQIETVSEGTIKANTVLAVMAISVGGGMAMAVVRAHLGFSILYYFIPGYFLALVLAFIVPKIYMSIAFDSGSIASGPMASSFVMPFVLGFSYAEKGADTIYEDAFGSIAMISMMPLVVIQLMGLYVQIKRAHIYKVARRRIVEPNDNQIVHMGEEA